MPNWCYNTLTIEHDDKEKIDAIEKVLEDDGEGILQDIVFNFSVTKSFQKNCSTSGCCKLSLYIIMCRNKRFVFLDV